MAIEKLYIEGAGREKVHQGRDGAQAAHYFATLRLKTDALQRTCSIGLQLLVFGSQKFNLRINPQWSESSIKYNDRTATTLLEKSDDRN